MKRRSKESGQTILLVAVFITILVGMAALAIDVTSLYVAHNEMQKTADAAALSGAKAFVDTTTTTAPADANLQALARLVSDAYVNAMVRANPIGGIVPSVSTSYNFTNGSNPQVTVTVQRTDVPTFFARVFGRQLSTVKATATAEAYNSSLPPGGGSNMPPVAPTCVKPWLIPNLDPRNGGDPFIDPLTGAIKHPGVYPNGIIGEEITLLVDCQRSILGSCVPRELPTIGGDPRHLADGLDWLPAQLASATSSCSSCSGSTSFQQSTACCDAANSGAYSCGSTAPGILFDITTNILSDTVSSVECLIGASGSGMDEGQDDIGLGSAASAPADRFGNFLDDNGRDPIEIKPESGPHSGKLVNTSPSIVTLPIYDNTGVTGYLLPVKIIGFMQAFVQQTAATDGDTQIYVLNISGCGPNVDTALTPISGGGTSPVPTRLIHQ